MFLIDSLSVQLAQLISQVYRFQLDFNKAVVRSEVDAARRI